MSVFLPPALSQADIAAARSAIRLSCWVLEQFQNAEESERGSGCGGCFFVFVGLVIIPGEGIGDVVFCPIKPLAIFMYSIGKEMGGVESSYFEFYQSLDEVISFL